MQACLNAPEPPSDNANGVDENNPVESPEDPHVQLPPGQPRGMPNNGMQPNYMNPESALHYQTYLQQQAQQQQASAQYPMPPQPQGMPRHPGHQQYPQDQKLS